MENGAIIHKSDSIYSFPVSEDTIELRLLVKKEDSIKTVELVYNDKYHFHEGVKYKTLNSKISDSRYDYYIERIKLEDYRFAYIFKITTNDNNIYYFSESGITKNYDISKGFYDFFQVSYINSSDIVKKHKKLQNRVFYQIFVDRFYNNNNKSPNINMKWGSNVNRYSFAGGNISGITKKIEYLEDLGVNALYLTPIFESESNHKYDIIDYFKISEDFGNEKDLHNLVKLCHSKDIVVFLDGVFNHVSIKNQLFQDVIKNGKNSKYFNWFFIKGEKADLVTPNYEMFAGVPEMPRLNLNNKECQEYVISVGLYYAKNFNIDGFRLDVSDEIPHGFWIKFKDALLNVNKDFALIGENWHNAHSFLNSGYEFDSIMNYGITKELLEFIAWNSKTAEQFKNDVIEKLMRYKTNVNYNMLNLLSSHDVLRFLTECKSDKDKLLLGYSFILMYVGLPCIYYGDEIGLEGGYDPDSRRCFNWDENSWDGKIRNTIKELISIHKTEKINELDYDIDVLDGLLVLTRFNKTYNYKLYINMTGITKKIQLSLESVLLSNLYKDNYLLNKGFLITKKNLEV